LKVVYKRDGLSCFILADGTPHAARCFRLFQRLRGDSLGKIT